MDGQNEPRWHDATEVSTRTAIEYERLVADIGTKPARFTRDMQTRVYRDGGRTTLVCTMDDDFHSMRLAVSLDGGGTIRAAGGQMLHAPYPVCPRALDALGSLVGANVLAPGIQRLLRDRIPKADGCIHLSDMLAAAFRVYRTSLGHDVPGDVDEDMRRGLLRTLPLMRDTCVAFAIEEATETKPVPNG